MDLISRQDAIDCEYQVKIINDIEYVMLSEVQMKMRKLPSAQPDWGKSVGNGRPLADCEIIPRLQAIKAQIGGSYAIDRAIEVLEGLRGEQDE